MSDPWDLLGDPAIEISRADCTVILKDGSELELVPIVALIRKRFLDQRAADRAAWCAARGLDPDRTAVCHDCEGEGWIVGSKLPCHCGMGRSQLKFVEKRERDQTERLRTLIADPGWRSRT